MPTKILEALPRAWLIAKSGTKTFLRDPQIIIYPLMAVGFIWLTSPIVTKFVVSLWRSVDHPEVLDNIDQSAPHVLLAHLGLVTFSIFYAVFVTSYFTCALSASVLAKLDDRSEPPLYGLRVMFKSFLRISWFALMAIFFFPLGVIAQRRKLPGGIIGVVGSSFTLSMAQLAPAIVSNDERVFDTVRHSITTLGKAWHESLIIRIGLFLVILLLGSISFLPKLVQHYWFDGHTAHIAGWIATAVFGVTSYVMVRVIGTIYTTTLYHQVSSKQKTGS